MNLRREMAGANALDIVGLKKSYRSGLSGRKSILTDLNLHVAKGDVYGLLGKNGAGKSTTFRILMGLCRPDAGETRILGERAGSRKAKMRIGFCPENPQFHSNLKVIEILRFHSSLAKDRIMTEKARIAWLIEQFELGEYRTSRISTLSRGTQQRLALALAVLARPEILILDEPLTALDPVMRNRVTEFLKEQNRAGMSMIISSHILSELEVMCDKLGVLANGRLQSELVLGEKQGDSANEMAIQVPQQFRKVIEADDPDLIGVQTGDNQCYEGLEFEKAQHLLKRWVAAGIPILEMKHENRVKEDILSSFEIDVTTMERESEMAREKELI
ncbi:MAG: ABC transporter ATP-binding protein [bacterium]|nr:ABC transporter ATP-binding protein [bacterium]